MPLNILIVDDSSVMRSMIIQTISLCSLNVSHIFEASNAEEGLDLMDSNWIDMIFIDLNMPGMNGLEMLEKIRNNPTTRDIHVLMVTTESNPERIEAFKKHEALFVHKPFTPEQLSNSIKTMIAS